MRKETSPHVSGIAARLTNFRVANLEDLATADPDKKNEFCIEVRTLAGSCLSQDEHAGQAPENFYDRLKREFDELDQRTQKLTNFLNQGAPGVKDEQQKELLECQIETMRVYRSILGMRLKTIPEPDRQQGKLRLASEDIGEPRELGGHDVDRDGPVPFGG